VSRTGETLSRMKNGAVRGGPADLILPVRVRTRTEDVDRTSEAVPLWGDVARALQETGVAKRPVNVTPKGGALAWMKCEPPPLVRSIEIELPCSVFWRDAIRLPSPAIRVLGAVIWR
jgi:hypothetical protein